MWFETRSFIHHVVKCFIERVTHTGKRTAETLPVRGKQCGGRKGLGGISKQLLVQGNL